VELVALESGREIGWWLSGPLRVAGSLVDAATTLPRRLELRGLGGNPASGPLLVEFAAPARVRARVAVFDLHGRLVHSLAEGDFEPGRHVLGWDGRTANGGDAGAGVFFIRAQAGGWSATLRRVRLR
jgi:hypothetical protein